MPLYLKPADDPISHLKRRRDEKEDNCTKNIDKVRVKSNIIDGETPEKPRLLIYGIPKYWSTKTTTKWVQKIGCPKGKIRKGQGQNFAIIVFQDEVRMFLYDCSRCLMLP